MKVVVQQCFEYDLEIVKEKVRKAFDELYVWDKINSQSRVFIKLNCLGPFAPEMAVTTHPVVLQAVIQLLKEKTNNIIVGDNPATRDIIYTLKKCGLMPIIIDEKVQIFNPTVLTKITNSNPHLYHTFEVTKEMIDVDVLINIPKLKTHTLAYMTCAEKNFFGLIYGLNKSAWHVKASNPLEFGEAMNDLYGAFIEAWKNKMVVHLCDGILGLEGEGPSSGGIPKKANVLLASYDAIALDRIACEVVHLDYKKLYINQIAHEREYGQGDINKIEIIGDSLNLFDEIKFLAPKDSLSHIGLKILRFKFLRNLLLEHPKISSKECIGCNECEEICPGKALDKGKPPHLKRVKCIRCWCCAEVCPKNAIYKSKRPLLGRLLLRQDKSDDKKPNSD